MSRNKEIILSGKGHRRRKLGPLGRRIRTWAILIGLGLFVAWSVGWMGTQRRVKQAQLDISRIAHAVRLFRADHGRCPAEVGELAAPPEGTPYMEEISDPWGQTYILVCPSRYDTDDADVISRGPDGGESSKDNIQNMVVELNL